MNENKFIKKSYVYDIARPSYPSALIEFMLGGFSSDCVVVDVGSGTGKLAEMVLEKGYRVYGVEPNGEMLDIAIKKLGQNRNYIPICTSAEKTTLEDGIADIVTVGQALHWFDIEQFKSECSRILKPSGKVFVIYNKFVGTLAARYELFLTKHCDKFKGLGGGDSLNKIAQFFGEYSIKTYDSQITYDSKKFIERALSSSYTPNKGEAGYDSFIQALQNFFDQHQDSAQIIFENRTSLYYKNNE